MLKYFLKKSYNYFNNNKLILEINNSCIPSIKFINDPKNFNNYNDWYDNMNNIFTNIQKYDFTKSSLFINYKIINDWEIIFNKITPQLDLLINHINNELDNIEIKVDKIDNLDLLKLINLTKLLKGYFCYENYLIDENLINIHNKLTNIYIELIRINEKNNNNTFIEGLTLLLDNNTKIEYLKKKNYKKNELIYELLYLINKNKIKINEIDIAKWWVNRLKYDVIDNIISNKFKNIIWLFGKKTEKDCNIDNINIFATIFSKMNKLENKDLFIIPGEYINIYKYYENILFNTLLNKLIYDNSKIDLEILNNIISSSFFNKLTIGKFQVIKNLYDKYLDIYLNEQLTENDLEFSIFIFIGKSKNIIPLKTNKFELIFNKIDKIIKKILSNNKLNDSHFKILTNFLHIQIINQETIEMNKSNIKNIILTILEAEENIFITYNNFLISILEIKKFKEMKEFIEIHKKIAIRLKITIINYNKEIDNIKLMINFKFWSSNLKIIEENILVKIYEKINKTENNMIKFIEIIKFLFIYQSIEQKKIKKIDKWNFENKKKEFINFVNKFNFNKIFKKLEENQENAIYEMKNITYDLNKLLTFLKVNVEEFDKVHRDKNILNIFVDKMYDFFKELINNNNLLNNYKNYDKDLNIFLDLIILIKRFKNTIFKNNKNEIVVYNFLKENILLKNKFNNNFFKYFISLIDFDINLEDYILIVNKYLSLQIKGPWTKSDWQMFAYLYKYNINQKHVYEQLDLLILNNDFNNKLVNLNELNDFITISVNVIKRNDNMKLIKLILNKIKFYWENYDYNSDNKKFTVNFHNFVSQIIFYINNKHINITEYKEFLLLENAFNKIKDLYKINFKNLNTNRLVYFTVFQDEIRNSLVKLGYKFKQEIEIEGFLIDFQLSTGEIIEVTGNKHYLGQTGIQSSLLLFKLEIFKLKNYKIIHMYSRDFYSFYNKKSYIIKCLLENKNN